MAKCGDCLYFDMCSHYVDAEETFPEVGGCCVFKNKGDFVEVVRCKDCKHLGFKGLCDGVCNKKMVGIVKPDDFCAYGERREGE